eukprot:CAMPEP_0185847160 /NCGR_PEP_ID=MMETSP1354-20130828/2541_1 /TAXON_ID=708628 /ORGANISM="Erythrolobus madagascarensis, Strain CCMP3276" /LENGTH=74 /DNA_ID=CAMNT_0028547419 /DNA_START=64 /DNA_END=288 /DNA_ORIENTATION=-
MPSENGDAAQAASAKTGAVTSSVPSDEKPKKKMCCACPETKKARDDCMVENGEEACQKLIEAHKVCLRAEGFNV